MEHVKRMVLVPEHVADNTTQRKPLIPPLTAQVNYLDSEMDSLLRRQDLTQDDKANMYNQILQRYLTYYDKRMSQPVRVSVVPPKPVVTPKPVETEDAKTPETAELALSGLPGEIESDILECVPPTMKARARQLVKKLKDNKDLVGWNDKAQLVFEGRLIPGSNVIDLVNDVLRHRKDFNPPGWQVFAKVLRNVNVPEGIVRNENLNVLIVREHLYDI